MAEKRLFHRAIDGTIPYFRSDGITVQEEGRLPEGSDPAELLAQGYEEAPRERFVNTRSAWDPSSSPKEATVHASGGRARMDPGDASAYADQVDAGRAEDDALAELSGAMDYAGLGRAQVPVPAATGTGNRRPAPRPNAQADVDALGSAWDDFYGRAQQMDVESVPGTVPLASRLGGQPIAGPMQRGAGASRAPVADEGPALDPDSLRGAQSRASLMRGLAGAGRGMSRVGAAIAGVRPEEGEAGAMERGADAQVRDFLQRRQQGEAERASAQKAAESDPSSPASQRFQAMVSRAFGSVYTPEQIQGMTAADAPMVGRYGEMVRTLEDRAAGRAAEQGSQQAQLTARATEAEKQRAFEGKQGAANRANALAIAGMRQGAAGDKADEAFQRRMSERNVGGFEIDPTNPPTADGAKKMGTVVEARENIRGSLDRLEELFRAHGPEMGGGIAQEQMQSELGNITTQLRLFNQMGVPNLNDYAELGKQIPQTAGVGAWFTRNATTLSKFKPLREQLDRAVASTARTYKFTPAGGAPNGAQAPTAGSAPRRKRDAQGQMWEEGPDGEMRMVL